MRSFWQRSVRIMSSKCDLDVSFDDDQESNSGGSNVMMSLFASYYGIDDPGSNVHNKTAAELIDTAHFNSEEYVRDLLEKVPLEKLVETNSEMINEIKSLDSDMQMLVYENYSKFISATETIKRMKINVEAMDEDIETVRSNMFKISTISSDLDSCFKNNRNKLAKLVRVRRLLKRLEFLTELPERIAEMIDGEKYGAAVKLYSKTINILKQHSQVLSFKNIQERTEKMMMELRNKVMILLDDNSIDPTKLTQHVSVLRLMEVPRQQIIEKFLNAHKIRAEKLLLLGRKGAISSSTMISTDGSAQNIDLGKVTDIRKFHQLLISNLTEACKGLTELFCAPNSSNTAAATPAKVGNSTLSSSSVSHSFSADSADGKLYSYTNRDEIRGDAAIAREKLDNTISTILPEYTKCVVSSLKVFFDRYNGQMQAYIDLESVLVSQGEGSEGCVENLQKAQLELYNLEEEKQGWVMLLRQAILDCQYLDASISECCNTGVDSDVQTIGNTEKFGLFFGMEAIETLHNHINTSFDRRGLAFVNKVILMIPQICSTSITGTGLRGSISTSPLTPTNKFSSAEGNLISHAPANTSETRNRISKNSSKIEQKIDRLIEFCLSTFSDICADFRPYLDIISVSDIKAFKLEEISMKIMWRYINFLCKSFDFACDVDVSLSDTEEKGLSYLSLSEFVLDIFTDKNPRNINHIKFNDGSPCNFDTSTKDYALIILSFLKRLNTMKTFNRFESIMKSHDLVITPKYYSNYELRCTNRLEMTIGQVLMKFIDTNCSYISTIIYQNIQDSIKDYPLPRINMIKDYDDVTVDIESPEPNELSALQKGLSVSKYVVDIAICLDSLLSSCSILLNEPLPPFKASSAERNLSRRGRARQGAMAQGRSGADVHLNIERLFAQKICIFDRESILKIAVGANSNSSRSTASSSSSTQQSQTPPSLVTITEVVLNSIIKCVLKYIHEHVRLTILPHGAYLQMQADISFIKHVAFLVLRETGEVEGIVELIYTSLFTRYIHANDIGLAGDSSNDITAILKATSDGLALASKRSLLLCK